MSLKIGWLRVAQAAGAGGLTAMLVLATGCGPREIDRREARALYAAGDQGGAWEAVLPTPEITAALEGIDPSMFAEFGRADDRLGAGTDGPLLATAQWPEPARATLERPRQILARDRDGRLTFFETERPHHGHSHHQSPRRGWYDWERGR